MKTRIRVTAFGGIICVLMCVLLSPLIIVIYVSIAILCAIIDIVIEGKEDIIEYTPKVTKLWQYSLYSLRTGKLNE